MSLDTSANDGLYDEIKKSVKNALDEYGEAEIMASAWSIEGDVSNLIDVFGEDDVYKSANNLDSDATIEDLFWVLVENYRFEKPLFFLDDRFQPDLDINDYFEVSEIESV